MVVIAEGGLGLLTSCGLRPEMLLNILQCMGQFPARKNDAVLNFLSEKVEKL